MKCTLLAKLGGKIITSAARCRIYIHILYSCPVMGICTEWFGASSGCPLPFYAVSMGSMNRKGWLFPP